MNYYGQSTINHIIIVTVKFNKYNTMFLYLLPILQVKIKKTRCYKRKKISKKEAVTNKNDDEDRELEGKSKREKKPAATVCSPYVTEFDSSVEGKAQRTEKTIEDDMLSFELLSQKTKEYLDSMLTDQTKDQEITYQ